MQWIISNDLPVHNQLVEELKLRIFLNFYRAGEKMPSVRDLSFEAKVNPNTMQKALTELETSGLIHTKRTSGKFVANSKVFITQAKADMSNEVIDNFISNIQKLDIDNQTIINKIKERLG